MRAVVITYLTCLFLPASPGTTGPGIKPTPDFPCSTNSSFSPSQSVNQLRPQDVGIIAAVGDSISAGVGATATNILDVFNEHRGVSFVTGGEGSWYDTLTLANIIKQFNPNLKGMSFGKTRAFVPLSKQKRVNIGLNMSISRSLASDVPRMVKALVRKVRRTVPDWRKLWKIVTILVGHNDVCNHTCDHTFLQGIGIDTKVDVSPIAFGENIRKAIKILYSTLPQTLVILLPIGDLTQILSQPSLPLTCSLAHWFVCPCWMTEQGRSAIPILTEQYRQQLYRIASDKKFVREDFIVEVMPTTSGKLPCVQSGLSDWMIQPGVLSPDCLHLSKAANGIFGRNLWNNLLQPWSNKEINYGFQDELKCPDEQNPYFATKFNSK